MSKKYTTVAIAYDFDGTLAKGNIQENSFIPELGMDKETFWKEVKKITKDNKMDEILSYMCSTPEKYSTVFPCFLKFSFLQLISFSLAFLINKNI
jgi:hypothetical protein